ncbi:MAG: hypothetical protein DI534_14860 [Leifsonia xyli]|nr:MAG: hypothetical protein DI534_14860 [Leifsonia xyli]
MTLESSELFSHCVVNGSQFFTFSFRFFFGFLLIFTFFFQASFFFRFSLRSVCGCFFLFRGQFSFNVFHLMLHMILLRVMGYTTRQNET